ncbi:MAG: hypothetical protein MJ139_06975, partial [Limosilactobacillus sp.]|nr:hypothetical protein [Limosilactobacillus sp.]
TVYLKHATKTVQPSEPKTEGTLINPDNPAGPKYPAGVAESNLNQTGTFTVKYTGAGDATPTDNSQGIKFHRTATVDEVTGHVDYGAWTQVDPTAKFKPVETPHVDGYVASAVAITAKNAPSYNDAEVQTVTYTKNGSYTIKVPAGHGENVTKDYTTNVDNPTKVNGFEVPEIDGFTPSVTGAKKQDDGSYLPIDPTKDATVTYTANAQSFNVTYVDDTAGETLTNHGFTLTGVTDASYATDLADKVWNFANAGYELDPAKNATNPLNSLNGTFGATNADVTVYLKHATTTVQPSESKTEGTLINPDNPDGPKYPAGVANGDLNQDAVFTIKYAGAGDKTPKEVV